MKKCGKCKIPKELNCFGKNKFNKDGLQSYCKTCKRITDNLDINHKSRSKINRAKIVKEINIKIINFKILKGGKCLKCNESRLHLLDFHHLLDKINSIRYILTNFGLCNWDKAEEEMNKCILLCANCHQEFHHFERNNGLKIDDYLKEKEK